MMYIKYIKLMVNKEGCMSGIIKADGIFSHQNKKRFNYS